MENVTATAPTLTNKQRKELFRTNLAKTKAARQAAQTEKQAIAERTANKVQEVFLLGAAQLLQQIEALRPAVEELAKTDDSLKAVLMRRKLHKLRMQYAEKAKVLTVQAKTARACGTAVLRASQTKTVTEQQRYELRLAKQAQKAAEQARLGAIAEKAAANPTLPVSHDTRVSSIGAREFARTAVLAGDIFMQAVASGAREVFMPQPRLTQNFAEHGKYNTGNRFRN